MSEKPMVPIRVALVGAEFEENLSLRYLRGALERAGYAVTQIAFNTADDLERAVAELAASGASLAGFSMVFTCRAREFADLARRARALGWRGTLVAGGHFAAFHAEDLLRDESAFDAVALGEGELVMTALAARGGDPAGVDGLVRRTADGRILRRPAAPPPDLDELPWPARRTPPDAYLGLPMANVLGSRGCEHACAFCSIAAWSRLCGGPRVRRRNPERLADELADLYRRGYRLFNFHDDNFLLPEPEATRDRVRALFAALRRRGVGRLGFAIKARPDEVDPALFAALYRRGLFRVFLGIEAGSPAALRRLGRGQTLDDNERALALLARLDLQVCFNLLMFDPDSTLEDARAHIAFLRAHANRPLNFCRTEVYAGTPLEARLRRAGRLEGDYWGRTYRIADPRTQTAFELMHHGLYARHHGVNNVHHLAMRVDFERQVRRRFYGEPRGLRDRVREYVRGVNLASAGFLDDLLDRAAEGPLSPAARAAAARELAARAAARNEADWRAGWALLADIRAVKSGAARPARSAGLKWAASLAVAAGIAADGRTQMTEMAPIPPREQPRPGEPVPPDATGLSQAVLFALAPRLETAAAVAVLVRLDADGHPADADVCEAGKAAAPPTLSDEQKQAVERHLARLGDSDFRIRARAAAELRALGAGVVPRLREAAAAATDPEIRGACTELANGLNHSLLFPRREEALAAIRAVTVAVPSQAGRWVLFSFGAEEIAMASGRGVEVGGLQICEMIAEPVPEFPPAPRD